MSITILYGTESGNAEMAADECAETLPDAVAVDLMDLEPADLDLGDTFLIVCSTYGDGELPASAQPFVDRLVDQKPDLSEMRYAIFGLGDSGYAESYGLGGTRLAEQLDALGAQRFGDFGRHDAAGSDDLVETVLAWAESTVAAATSAA
ncbi:flavodoxin domain-containing protein [Aeromicrobium fastidiosum]|uniref:Nitric oxide synthase n=1 Tax=Aeromicrobium fastidiosum TaxID=52699 RepID=A0A641ASD0_9ACTN|nr:flavodoxin domain-containing protein [Aeromicrobium fastidiosum]KAA1380582.1 nitric oxide synthase [Aeromicrobium fastidiosum]MBP2390180.1 MioC protein [Aeromicrobium fastidiosum]